jgi:hypothetical protein
MDHGVAVVDDSDVRFIRRRMIRGVVVMKSGPMLMAGACRVDMQVEGRCVNEDERAHQRDR